MAHGTDQVINLNDDGVTINSEGTTVTYDSNGVTFVNEALGSEYDTVINGGKITTSDITARNDVITIDENGKTKYSLNTVGADLEKLSDNVGTVSADVEGIKRDGDNNIGYTTSIETTFKVHSLGTGSVDIFGSKIESTLDGQTTVINGGSITTNSLTVGGVSFGEVVNSVGDLVNRVEDLEDKTQNITSSNSGTGEGGSVVPPTTDGQTGVNGDVTVGGDLSVGGNLKADSGTIGGVTMENGQITTGNTTINGTGVTTDKVTVGQTSVTNDGVTVGNKETGYTSITNNDVVINNNDGSQTSLANVGNRVTGLESSMNSMNNRINDVEDRIDKVGAMAAAIANLRTMGFDPEAPTEIAIGVGQYKSETGLALGVFHYPNQDFMLSASISTSGDEVMGGIGATWKLGRKSAAEKAKDEEAKRLEKAEDMKKLAQEEKVKAQAERHAKLLAEREAQETA